MIRRRDSVEENFLLTPREDIDHRGFRHITRGKSNRFRGLQEDLRRPYGLGFSTAWRADQKDEEVGKKDLPRGGEPDFSFEDRGEGRNARPEAEEGRRGQPLG